MRSLSRNAFVFGCLLLAFFALLTVAAPPARAQDGERRAETAYPREALAFLPKEALDQLPQILTLFLTPSDWAELSKVCNRSTARERVECMTTGDIGKEVTRRIGTNIMKLMIGNMDGEIPRRLGPADIEALDQQCDKQGEAWADCTVRHGIAGEACAEPERDFASCLVQSERVQKLFTKVQREKKAAFGKDAYAGVAGLLAPMELATVKQIRKACPEDDIPALFACLDRQPEVAALAGQFAELSAQIVEHADGEIRSAGAPPIDKAQYTQKVLLVLLAIPFESVKRLVAQCEKDHPELEKLDSAAELDASIACVTSESETDPVSNPAFIKKETLKKWLEIGRTKVIDKLREKAAQSSADSLRRTLSGLGIVAMLGPLAIFLYALFGLRRRFADKMPIVWKSSAIASATFVGTIAVLAFSLVIVKVTQDAVSRDATSPPIKIANGAFDVIEQDRYLQGFSDLSRTRLDFLKEPLRVISEPQDEDGPPIDAPTREAAMTGFVAHLATHWAQLLEEPEVKRFAKNAKMLASHAGSFKKVISFYKTVQWVLAILPYLMAFITVFTYLWPMRATLKDIITMPARVASGTGGASDATSAAKKLVIAELKIIGPFLAVVLLCVPVIGVFLGAVVKPLLEMVILEALLMVFYILFSDASAPVIYASLGSTVVLLGASMAVYIVTLGAVLGTSRNLFKSKFYFGHSLSKYKKQIGWSFGCFALLLVLPLVYANGANAIFRSAGKDIQFTHITSSNMLLVPLATLLAFPVVLWAARGIRAIQYIKKLPVDLTPAVAGAPVSASPALAAPAPASAAHAQGPEVPVSPGPSSYGASAYGPSSYGASSYGPSSYGPSSHGPASYGPGSPGAPAPSQPSYGPAVVGPSPYGGASSPYGVGPASQPYSPASNPSPQVHNPYATPPSAPPSSRGPVGGYPQAPPTPCWHCRQPTAPGALQCHACGARLAP